MEREDILKIIAESPLSIHLSNEEKKEIIERILGIWKGSDGPNSKS